MKITELRNNLKQICAKRQWDFQNNKQRGMAFEDWCFGLFADRYPAAENDPDHSIIRGDDTDIDIVFESKETDEIYILQCKHPKIAASEPISKSEVKSFFSTYHLLNDRKYLDNRKTFNPKIQELAIEFEY